jgi:hypothetical protein
VKNRQASHFVDYSQEIREYSKTLNNYIHNKFLIHDQNLNGTFKKRTEMDLNHEITHNKLFHHKHVVFCFDGALWIESIDT